MLLRILIPAVSWAITLSVGLKYMAVTTAQDDKNSQLLSRLSSVTSLCLHKEKSKQQYKNQIKLLKRSLTSVRRDLGSSTNSLAIIKENAKRNFGKGGNSSESEQNGKSTIRSNIKK